MHLECNADTRMTTHWTSTRNRVKVKPRFDHVPTTRIRDSMNRCGKRGRRNRGRGRNRQTAINANVRITEERGKEDLHRITAVEIDRHASQPRKSYFAPFALYFQQRVLCYAWACDIDFFACARGKLINIKTGSWNHSTLTASEIQAT